MEENKIFIKQENKSKIFFRKTIDSFFYNHTVIGNLGQLRLFNSFPKSVAMYINNPNI